MAKRVRFVLNRPAVKAQIHNGPGTRAMLAGVAASMDGPGIDVEVDSSNNSQGGGRLRARAKGKKPSDVSAALGRARV